MSEYKGWSITKFYEDGKTFVIFEGLSNIGKNCSIMGSGYNIDDALKQAREFCNVENLKGYKNDCSNYDGVVGVKIGNKACNVRIYSTPNKGRYDIECIVNENANMFKNLNILYGQNCIISHGDTLSSAIDEFVKKVREMCPKPKTISTIGVSIELDKDSIKEFNRVCDDAEKRLERLIELRKEWDEMCEPAFKMRYPAPDIFSSTGFDHYTYTF